MEKWIDEAFERACAKLEHGAKPAAAQGISPYMGEKGRYAPSPFDGNSWWTGGFWPGMMWQLYRATGKDVYKDEALRVEDLLTEEFRKFDLLNHDVGFMYLLSTGAHDKLLGDAQAHTDTLHAATLLAGLYPRVASGGKGGLCHHRLHDEPEPSVLGEPRDERPAF